MGIKNGAPEIIPFLKNGIYNRNASSYKVMVDGELMRYKGMIQSNLTKHNVEEAIAVTSYDYLHNTLMNIGTSIGRIPEEVIIYMDGSRVANKETTRADFRFDAQLIRTIFQDICNEHGHKVIELPHGESELQMYLQRDRKSPLNVFLTNDSDMISICYGHKALSKTSQFILMNENENFIRRNELKTRNITDNNIEYKNSNDIVDSCVWVNCARNGITLIGFDFIDTKFLYTQDSFRVFISLCGTDFTHSLLTTSMVSGILTAKDCDKHYINSLTDINQIAACFQMLGIRSGGTIKRHTPQIKDRNKMGKKFNSYDPNEIVQSIKMYRDYISFGSMANITIPRPNMAIICRQYLYAMRGQDSNFVKKNLMSWACKTTLQEAVENLIKYHGTYNGSDDESDLINNNGKSTKSPTKRKSKHDSNSNDLLHQEKIPKFEIQMENYGFKIVSAE
ncbi:PolH/gran [Drosophila innubila nudivirus]|uniref:PolH/gran n=1 Tax=Drosophila innubila nudivirus TaxID=2057187 RepID=A0A2H4UXD5_9VIRU|nr:PolH/gran [Drosophila innubila nudivirus]ATZ81581.1 PolH/gran [Drosophila innubila nudivirus]